VPARFVRPAPSSLPPSRTHPGRQDDGGGGGGGRGLGRLRVDAHRGAVGLGGVLTEGSGVSKGEQSHRRQSSLKLVLVLRNVPRAGLGGELGLHEGHVERDRGWCRRNARENGAGGERGRAGRACLLKRGEERAASKRRRHEIQLRGLSVNPSPVGGASTSGNEADEVVRSCHVPKCHF